MNTLKTKKNKLLIEATWMNLKIILLSKRSQTSKTYTTYMKYEHSRSSNNIVSFNIVLLQHA